MDWASPGVKQIGKLTGDGGYLLTAGDLGQWEKTDRDMENTGSAQEGCHVAV